MKSLTTDNIKIEPVEVDNSIITNQNKTQQITSKNELDHDHNYENDFNVDDDFLDWDKYEKELDSKIIKNVDKTANKGIKRAQKQENTKNKRIRLENLIANINNHSPSESQKEETKNSNQENSSDNHEYFSKQEVSLLKAEELEFKLLETMQRIELLSHTTKRIVNEIFPKGFNQIEAKPLLSKINLDNIIEISHLIDNAKKFNQVIIENSSTIIQNQHTELKIARQHILELTIELNELKYNQSSNKEDKIENSRKRLRVDKENDGLEEENEFILKNHIEKTFSPLKNIQNKPNSNLIVLVDPFESSSRDVDQHDSIQNAYNELINRCSNVYRNILRRNLKKNEFLSLVKEKNLYIPYKEFDELRPDKKNDFRVGFLNNRFIIYHFG